MTRRTWMIGVIALLVMIILFLLFRQYVVSHTLSDVVMVLLEQVWSLRERCIQNTLGGTNPIAWEHDALSVSGRRGDLLIRRHRLHMMWAHLYAGVNTPQMVRVQKGIVALDDELRSYGLYLHQISSMTLRMVEEIHHGEHEHSINLTKTIVRHIRMV